MHGLASHMRWLQIASGMKSTRSRATTLTGESRLHSVPTNTNRTTVSYSLLARNEALHTVYRRSYSLHPYSRAVQMSPSYLPTGASR